MGFEIQFRRKAVNIIEDSDSDAGSTKETNSLNSTEKVTIDYNFIIIKYMLNYNINNNEILKIIKYKYI